MDDFEKDLGNAENTLGTNEPRIRHALAKLDLDTSALTAFRETQHWIGSKRPELRRRNETIQAVRQDWTPGSDSPRGLTPFDEPLYSRAGTNPDAYAATLALHEAAQKRKIDDATLAQLEKRTGDANFATMLMYGLGATKFRSILTESLTFHDKAAAQRLQAALGKTLATASPRLSLTWRTELMSDPPDANHYGLSLALAHGTYDATFLLDVAQQMDALSRKPWTPGTEFHLGAFKDPMLGVMTALSRVPEAAQDFFAQDPTALERFINGGRPEDGGKALSAALLAATTTFRDHDTSPHPSRGFLSAKLASELVHLEAQRLNEGDPLRVTPGTLSRVFASYISDVNRVAAADSDEAIGVAQEDHPGLPGQEDWGARFVAADLKTVMTQVFKEDQNGFMLVAGAQTIWASKLLDASATRMATGEGSKFFSTAAGSIGAGFGFITDAAGLARIEKGQELDEEQQRNIKTLTALVNTGLAIPQHAAWPLAAGAIGSWTGIVEDSLKGDEARKGVTEANKTVTETRFLTHQLAVQAMFNHGLFGPADPPGEDHPWKSLSHLRQGDDPRKAPNNFLKDDGKTLMTREELLAARDAHGIPAAYDAYRRWLYQGLAGESWEKVRTRLDAGYDQGFAKYR